MSLLRALEPGLLLAAPSLGDPNFAATVVLLGIHDADDGSLGWVVNGPTIAPAETILRATELGRRGAIAGERFFHPARRGGPVAPESVWILYDCREGERLPGSIAIGEEIAVTATAEALQVLLAGGGPADFRLLVGYAGWGRGQLEEEIARGAWLPASAPADLVFEQGQELDSLWERAYKRAIGTVPSAFVSRERGSA